MGSPDATRAAVLVSAAVIVLWALRAADFNTAQFADNIEQFNWAQSLKLGYHKHPLLPSWVLAIVTKLFGPSACWAYVLATPCLLGTLGFTFRIGRELVGDRLAAASVLWGLHVRSRARVAAFEESRPSVRIGPRHVVGAPGRIGACWRALRARRTRRDSGGPDPHHHVRCVRREQFGLQNETITPGVQLPGAPCH
jgi:hypothetical protein